MIIKRKGGERWGDGVMGRRDEGMRGRRDKRAKGCRGEGVRDGCQ